MPTLGLFGANMGACATPDAAVQFAALAGQLGYHSLWMGEHVVAPNPRAAPSPIEPDYPILDPLVTLAFVAAETGQARLATGIVILPQRNPVVLAKELATLDEVSRGRLVFGVGVGYVEPEMRAVGVPIEGRGARAVEYLQAMRSLWHDEAPAFDEAMCPSTASTPIRARCRTRSRLSWEALAVAAHRRAVRHADGWYGFLLDRAETAAQVESLRREAEAAGRALDGFTVAVSPSERLDPGVVQDYEALGVDRLVLVPPGKSGRTGDTRCRTSRTSCARTRPNASEPTADGDLRC